MDIQWSEDQREHEGRVKLSQRSSGAGQQGGKLPSGMRQRATLFRERFELDAVKIFLILTALTAGMALALRSFI